MEVIEDGNIMDRIPILLQRDFEYYQTNQTVLSETICCGVVGGSLDFPRNASFSAAKIVLWLEDEFSIAFKQGSGMFVQTEDEKPDSGVAKTSSPDKFVQLAVKSADMLLEHLHVLVQEALDHADLPVLTATLGAAAVLKNSLYCYVQYLEDMGSSERLTTLQACYKRYVTMFEAVGERLLDLHNRVLSLYIIQDAGGRPIDDAGIAHENGTPSVHGWWLYMNGIKKDLWNTVPPRMAQRIFAGMLNETLTILTVRYCQATLSQRTLPLFLNDCLNILLCAAQLLPSICARGSDLAGLDANSQSRDVRDVHTKCNELFKCMVLRGAEVHFIHQTFKDKEATPIASDNPYPWFTFVSPHLFQTFDDPQVKGTRDLQTSTAVGLELIVLLAQPQPSWPLLIKVLMMRNCHLARLLLTHAVSHMSIDNARWPASGLWYSTNGRKKCNGFLCTADGFCQFKPDNDAGIELARAAGALTYILAAIGSKSELKCTLCDALEVSGRDWAAFLDQRQIWCDRRPPWLAGLLGLINTALQYIPEVLVNAVNKGASMYQTMSLCLNCIERSLDCIPDALCNAAAVIEGTLPSTVNPIGGSVLLQLLLTKTYEEITYWAKTEEAKEKAALSAVEVNGIMKKSTSKTKHVRIVSLNTNTSTSSVSFDGSHSSPSSIAFAIAEALCSIGEDDKHTQQIEKLVAKSKEPFLLLDKFGLEDLPQFAAIMKEGEDVPSSNAERENDADTLTSEILMTSPGRDSVRVIYNHLQLHRERVFAELGISEGNDCKVNLSRAPLLYVMFHIGRRPFDQYFRNEWPMPWSRLVAVAKRWSTFEGARVHINRRVDIRNVKAHPKNKQLQELYEMFKSSTDQVLL